MGIEEGDYMVELHIFDKTANFTSEPYFITISAISVTFET